MHATYGWLRRLVTVAVGSAIGVTKPHGTRARCTGSVASRRGSRYRLSPPVCALFPIEYRSDLPSVQLGLVKHARMHYGDSSYSTAPIALLQLSSRSATDKFYAALNFSKRQAPHRRSSTTPNYLTSSCRVSATASTEIIFSVAEHFNERKA